MKYGDQTSFRDSFRIQLRVIGALMMREVITRYGRKNIGVLWLFVEPLLFSLMISAVWGFARADRVSDLNILAFVITGYPLMMMWRNASNRAIGAISANSSLLYHRNVRVLDTIVSRMLLEVAGATIAQILIISAFVALDWIPMPIDPFYMVMAWCLMIFFAFGLGLVICAIAQQVETFSKLWSTFSFLLMMISGVFFFVHSLPQNIRDYVQWIPMVSGSEMFRHGYFGDIIPTYENIPYLITIDLLLLWLGLVMIRHFSRGVEPR